MFIYGNGTCGRSFSRHAYDGRQNIMTGLGTSVQWVSFVVKIARSWCVAGDKVVQTRQSSLPIRQATSTGCWFQVGNQRDQLTPVEEVEFTRVKGDWLKGSSSRRQYRSRSRRRMVSDSTPMDTYDLKNGRNWQSVSFWTLTLPGCTEMTMCRGSAWYLSWSQVRWARSLTRLGAPALAVVDSGA